MPDLPERADIGQLRRQARELLRAVPGRPALAAAQLAVAREHGFRSWPALRSEVESRRQPAGRQLRADAGRPGGKTSPGAGGRSGAAGPSR